MYNYWDQIALNPPPASRLCRHRLLYQPTSWEYVQFLYLANTRPTSFWWTRA